MIKKLLIILLLLIGIYYRLVDINWGAPYYFHPDERNVIYSVAGLNFPNQMNPHFFAYGSLPIYAIYFLSLFSERMLHINFFASGIISSRVFSFIFSSLLIPSMYFVGKKLKNKHVGIIAMLLTSFSVGLIQYAHFGTFEMWLTFFTLWFFFFTFQLYKEKGIKYIVISGLILGILLSVKVSSAVLILFPLLLLNYKTDFKEVKHSIVTTFFVGVIAILIFFLTNPFSILDYNSFRNGLSYESSVALGTLPVFYTQSFYRTLPVVFQILNVFPFLLNPVVELIFLFAVIFSTFSIVKKKESGQFGLLLIFCILFFSQAFFFVKWARYMVPTIPFILLLLSIWIESLSVFKNWIISFLIFLSFLFASFFVKTVYLQMDSRIEAAVWSEKNISPIARVVSEVYDLGIIPFNQTLSNITLENFYDIDQSPIAYNNVIGDLSKTDYIIIPSQRVAKTRLLNGMDFPKGHLLYSQLLTNSLQFKKIYQTSCDIYCALAFPTDKIFPLEETVKVFDRPTVVILKKK